MPPLRRGARARRADARPPAARRTPGAPGRSVPTSPASASRSRASSSSTGRSASSGSPVTVVGRGREAEPDAGAVGLLPRGQEAREPRRPAHAQHQHARGKRIQRARVADAPRRGAPGGRGPRCRGTWVPRACRRPGRRPRRLLGLPVALVALGVRTVRRLSFARAFRFAALPLVLEQARHAVRRVEPLVVAEVDLGRVADAEPLAELAADEAARLLQRGEALLPLAPRRRGRPRARARSAGRARARRGSRSRSRCAGPSGRSRSCAPPARGSPRPAARRAVPSPSEDLQLLVHEQDVARGRRLARDRL